MTAPKRHEAGRPAVRERLVFRAELLARIGESLELAYPAEGCGVLLGRLGVGWREVRRAVPTRNRGTRRSDRYEIDPETLARLVAAEDGGAASRVLGFYHSHADAEPEPSVTDRELAWPWYDYVIWPVHQGMAGAPRAWRLSGDRFDELDVRVGDACESNC